MGGCSSTLNKVSKPTTRGYGRDTSIIRDLPPKVIPAEDDSKPTRKMPERRWSQGSLGSASSLLSLERVAAGHGGNSILKYVDKYADEVPEIPKYVMKVWDDVEARVYQELGASEDSIRPFTPEFFGEVDSEDLVPGLESRYMRLSNVLQNFGVSPNVMDCKIGIRSFAEEEVHKTKPRKDLYQKLEKLDPSLPTEEERQARACTKFRWMSVNDAKTTLQSLGFRIDGIENSKGKMDKDNLKNFQSPAELARVITEEFLHRPTRHPAPDNFSDADTYASNEDANFPGLAEQPDDKARSDLATDATGSTRASAELVLKSLRSMREAMMASEFVRSHSFVGCSLLFIADAHGPAAGVYLIDFAHTTLVPDGMEIDHRTRWKAGNHEDGLLLGMDNIIECWEKVLAGFDETTESTAAPMPRTDSSSLASL